MPSVRVRALLLTFPSALAGCGSMPPYCVGSPAGEVCAESLAQAEEVAERLVVARAALARWLPDHREVELELWVQEELDMGPFVRLGDSSLGVTRRKGDWARVHVRSADPELVLVHELVHASLGESWEELSDALEEGLCDVANVTLAEAAGMRELRLRCAARTGPALRALRWRIPDPKGEQEHGPEGGRQGISFWGAMGGSDAAGSTLAVAEILDAPRIRRFEGPAADHAYGVSYFCVDRIVLQRGLRGLQALCARARAAGLDQVPSAWAIEAAGFPDAQAFEAAARAALFEMRALAVLDEPALWRILGGLAGELEPRPASFEEIARRCEVTIAFGDGAPVALLELPGFGTAAKRIQILARGGASVGQLGPVSSPAGDSSRPGGARPW